MASNLPFIYTRTPVADETNKRVHSAITRNLAKTKTTANELTKAARGYLQADPEYHRNNVYPDRQACDEPDHREHVSNCGGKSHD
jgi:hypothetical protein